MGYQIPVLKALVDNHHAEAHVVHWDKNKLTPYEPPDLLGVKYRKRSEFKERDLLDFAIGIRPDLVYISGWQDRGYLPVADHLRKLGKPVVAGFDDQWQGSMRQRLGSILVRSMYKRKYFSHAWVAGPYQYEYARRMGFNKNEILFNLLSGNTELFGTAAKFLERKAVDYPKVFLYVGSFRFIKGVDILAEAFEIYKRKHNGGWKLLCVGNGEMKPRLMKHESIEFRDFSSQEELLEISKSSGAFILPSRHEQWGVVAHEFTSAGLPLILSENVGSRPLFLVDGHNGYTFRGNSAENLARTMVAVSSKSGSELARMGANSHALSVSISPSICAATLVSVLRG